VYLEQFVGMVSYTDHNGSPLTTSVGAENFFLKGCCLRNTPWVIGVCVYTGHETKIMLNS